MSIQDTINKQIQDEIINDPHSVGYDGKSDDEIAALLNSPIQVPRTVYDILPSPMNRILSGIAEAPNAVVVDDVTMVTQSPAFQTAKQAAIVEPAQPAQQDQLGG